MKRHQIANGDCFELLKNVPDNSVDMCLTDPPYFLDGLGDDWDAEAVLSRQGQETSTVKSLPKGMKFDRSQGYDFQKFMDKLSIEVFRVLKPGGIFISFSAARLYHRMTVAVEDAGFDIRDMIGWTYQGQAKAFGQEHIIKKQHNLTDDEKNALIRELDGWKTPQLKPCIEPMCLAQKPLEGKFIDNYQKYKVGLMNSKQTIDGMFPGNIIECKKPSKEEKGHTNIHVSVKPLTLIEHFIKLFTRENQVVLDPFLGSGTTLIAAQNTNRICIGFEISSKYYPIILQRYNSATKNDRLAVENLQNPRASARGVVKTLWFDLETYSPVPINEGTYRYAERVSVLIFIYALDDGEVKVWDVASGAPMPDDLRVALADPTVQLAAHNVAFDRTVLIACGYGEEYPLEPERFLCTMTVARMARFPGSLDALCKALGLPEQYAKRDGNALIKKFCMPTAQGLQPDPSHDPAAWQRFVDYAVHDVVSMRECMKRIPNVMNDAERMLYAYTTRMNDRGVAIDRELAVRCAFQVADLKTRFKREARQLVGEEEFNVVSQKALLGYLKSHGIELPDARISTVQDFLESEQAEVLPAVVLDVLRTRLKTNKAAVAKHPAILKRLNSDDRLRGLIVHAGAGNTHRDSSVGPQFQNLARPVLLDEKLTMEQACEIAKAGASELFFEDPMQLHSDCVRGTVIAPPGKKLCVADLSNIEGRSVVWLAGEEWKLKYFRDFDEGKIRFDNYVAAYAKAFNISPVSVTKAQRQVGKVLELACSYGGSVGAFITFAAIYRVDLDAMALAVREAGDAALWSDCDAAFDWFEDKQMTYGLSRDTWTGCYYLVKAWRAAHSAVVATWNRAEEAFTNAVKNPGVWFEGARDCHFFNSEGWVFARLPSGRMMVFPKARLEDTGGRGSSLTFMGVSAFTKKWGVQRTYGGRLVENITQSFSRDVLLWNVPAVEQAGYPVVLRVHDELVTEPDDDPRFTGGRLAQLMATRQAWCADLPLAAVGEDLYRYQKS